MLAAMDGDLERAIALGEQLVERAQFLGMPQFASLASRGQTRAQIYTGSPVDALPPPRPPLRPFFLAFEGQHERAEESLANVLPAYQTEEGAVDALVYAADLAFLLEAALVLNDRQVAGLIAPLFADSPGASAVGAVVCYQRLVGAAYVLLGEPGRAQLHYRQAIESCTRMRFRPELALCKLELAELLLEHSPEQRDEALAHLDFAIEEFRAMKMQPALERALRHKGLLHA
jgi:hypothetical protein